MPGLWPTVPFQRLLAGVHWEDAAAPDDLALNGAAMRIAPVGLWHCDRQDRLAADVTIASVVTHRHPLAVDAAIAMATAVAHAVTASRIETGHLLATAARSVEARSPQFAQRIAGLGKLLHSEEADALAAIAQGDPRQAGFGVPAMAEPTVLAALYAFLRSPGDFAATVETSLRMGGDVDTIAAIAGALSGAHNGLDAIPPSLADGVKDGAEILDLGNRLFSSAVRLAVRENAVGAAPGRQPVDPSQDPPSHVVKGHRQPYKDAALSKMRRQSSTTVWAMCCSKSPSMS